MDETILVERDGPIATVVLNRADKLNALTRPMWQGLGDALRALSADDDVRCIVIRGAGERAFSPGNDISEFATERSNKAQAREYGKVMHATAQALAECRHPLVAQIHGICVGGGLEIAALSDLRICGAVEPLRRADQEPRAGDGLRRDGAAGAPGRPRGRARNPARRADLRCAEAKEKGLVTRVVAGRPGGRRGTRHSPAHCRRRAAGRALAQEVRAAPRRPAIR